jgi:hypothetical protein
LRTDIGQRNFVRTVALIFVLAHYRLDQLRHMGDVKFDLETIPFRGNLEDRGEARETRSSIQCERPVATT